MDSDVPRLNEPTYPPSKKRDGDDSETESDNSFNSYDAIASEYAKIPSEAAGAAWMKELVEKHKGWIGFDQMGSNIKALDYCPGTGFLSQALAPHVHQIIAVDGARNMVIEYNKIAEQTKDDHPNCELRAVWGDLIDEKEPEDKPWASAAEFDLIAMCTPQWDCVLVGLMVMACHSQAIAAMLHAMAIAVRAEETPGNSEFYIYLSFTSMWLLIRFYLFQSNSILRPTLPHLYIASISLPVYVAKTLEFFLALGYENMPVQASIRRLALTLRRPNHDLRHLYALMCARDVCCSFEYETTNVDTAR